MELLKDLPGVYNDEDMYDSLENMQKFFTAKRSVVVAESYALVNMFPEALKVYSHLADTFEVTPDFYKTDSFPYDVTSIEQVKELSNTIQSSLSRAHVMAQFHREQSGASDYVMDNVYKFPIADKVNKITDAGEKGALRPMLSKAVLFDIAFNYISYSTRGDSSTKEAKASGDKKKSGFFGIFGR